MIERGTKQVFRVNLEQICQAVAEKQNAKAVLPNMMHRTQGPPNVEVKGYGHRCMQQTGPFRCCWG